MDTKKLSSLVKTGDIVMFYTPLKWYKPLTWLSALIRFFTGASYNHVGVVVRNWDQPFINEAVAKGVIAIPFEHRFSNQKVLIFRFEKPQDERDFAIKANSKIGKTPYDFVNLFVWQLWFQLSGRWIGPTGDESKMVCSEYVAWCYQNRFSSWQKTDPEDIERSIDEFTDSSVVYEGTVS